MGIELGTIGIWRHPSGLTPEMVAEVEALGYGAIWVGGSPGGDLSVAENLLDTTDHIAVATGIVNVWKDDAATIGADYHRITARHPGRFLLGLGIGHPEATPEYRRPYTTLVVHGDAQALGRGVTAHLDAGADHVAVQVLGSDPLPALRALAGLTRS